MKIVFLASARPDLDWYVEYYSNAFPQGMRQAKLRYMKTKQVLAANPSIGHPAEVGDFRELPISRTPFLFVYRVRKARIEIVRLWDQRAKRPRNWV